MAHVCPDLLDFADSVFVGEAKLSNAGDRDDDGDDDISDESDEDDVSDMEGDGGVEDDDASESGEEEWDGIGDVVGDENQGAPELSAGLGAKASGGTFRSILSNVANSRYVGATRYVPPHLRGAQPPQNQDLEVDIRLTKQLKGLLNRQALVEIYQMLAYL